MSVPYYFGLRFVSTTQFLISIVGATIAVAGDVYLAPSHVASIPVHVGVKSIYIFVDTSVDTHNPLFVMTS